MRAVKIFGAVACSFVAGIAFVVACESGGGSSPGTDGGLFDAGRDANAGGSDCPAWEVVQLSNAEVPSTGDTVGSADIRSGPPGWEPYAYASGPTYLFRRCAP